ncbi:MAG: NAD-binding protein [Saprospiraceae bacterium]|nr:NAD-binding protein [Saprospiraceae bacterium]
MNPRTKNIILYSLFSLIFIAIINFILLHFEKGQPGSVINNISDAIWYMLVSITSVGYGDKVPVTNGGRVIGYFYVIASLGVLGVLISSISSNIYTMIEEKKLGYRGTSFEDHIVFIGWNDFSRMVVDEVHSTMRQFAVVTNKKDDVDLFYEEYKKKKSFVLFADYHNLDVIEKVNPSKASEVFINFGNDTDSLLYVINFKTKYPQPDIIVSLENSKLKNTFLAAGVKYVVSSNEIASKLVASYIFEPDVAELNIDLLSSAQTEFEFDNQEYKVIDQNPYLGKDYIDAFVDIKMTYDCVLLGISKLIDGNRKLLTNPKRGTKINMGDYLILMTSGATKKRIERDFGIFEGRI